MRKLAIALATTAAVMASPALARDGAWYIGGDFGATMLDDTEFDVGAIDDAIQLDHEYGFDGALFVGYDLGGFRIEAETAYKKADIEEIDSLIALPGGAAPGLRDAGGGSTSALSFMINGMLDFGDGDGISGFVGGGVGMAKVDFDSVRAFENQGAFIDDDDTKFAWQVVAGLRQAISDSADVTVRYRYFNVSGISLENNNVEGSLRSHSLLGGITFNFGAPEPPPPPPPAPPPPPPPPPRAAPPPPPPPVARCNQGPYIVFFDWDSDVLTSEATTILNNAVTAYGSCGTSAIMVAGHADKSGSAEYNMGLAGRRAANVVTYVTGRGVPAARISSQSFGESMPRVPTADGVRELQNRRVEVTYGPGAGR